MIIKNNNIEWSQYCVIIPAFNAKHTLPQLIDKLRYLYPKLDIIVVDDGSDQKLVKIIGNKVKKVVIHKRNRGKGEALKSGIRGAKIRGKKYGIFLDADLQHAPE